MVEVRGTEHDEDSQRQRFNHCGFGADWLISFGYNTSVIDSRLNSSVLYSVAVAVSKTLLVLLERDKKKKMPQYNLEMVLWSETQEAAIADVN